ncbi:MAG TPA: MAPEG family protein [Caulobacteraceae bacterium]|nr:MAPEG family protein [Caulobacteraceae bacterium]
MTTVNPPIISAFTAGILMLLQTALVFAAVNQRRLHGPSLGESSDPNVIRAVRRHGNLAENAAIFIACVALLEMLGGGRPWVAILCAAFLIARLSHAFGLSLKNTVNGFRVVGVVLTVAVGLGLGGRLIVVAVQRFAG